ncbi:hypothetical protein TNCV_2949341 [Trichonephila clavipes]|nr:hypothetical protein TNCV_2949341 [Trichonephila clavipes]
MLNLWRFKVLVLWWVEVRKSGVSRLRDTLRVASESEVSQKSNQIDRAWEREERMEVSDQPQGVVSSNGGEPEKDRNVTCMVLKAKTNDRRKNLVLRNDEFRGP